MKFLQNLGRSLMLPVAVLPVAAVLSGLGYWITQATHNPNNVVGAFLSAAGLALIGNIALLFALGVAIGMPKKADGTAALAGLVSWLTVTKLLAPASIASFQGVAVDAVDPAFGKVENVFVGILCGLIAAWSFDHFKDTKLPDYLAFFSGRRSVAIVASFLSIIAALVLMFVWPVLFGALVAFGKWMVTLGPVGVGLYGFFNRMLIPLGLHHALNAVFWFDLAGINDLNNFLAGKGTPGVTGQYMTGFFPIMMFGLPGAALAMYSTAKPGRKRATGGLLFSAAFAAFLVGITEPLEFLFMFVAPGLYAIHAVFTGISMAVTAALPVRSGFGFSAGFIDLVLQWVNPLSRNPWAIFLLGAFWFVVYFVVFRWVILRWNLKTPGREDDEVADEQVHVASSDDKFVLTGARFLDALGGKENIDAMENCASRLRLQLHDVSRVDEAALKRAGAAGVVKPGGKSFQVIYGLNVQFVKDAMDGLMDGSIARPALEAAGATAGSEEQALVASASDAPAAQRRVVRLLQPVPGRVVGLEQVPDKTFSDRVLGGGVAIEPSDGTVVAPAAGTISQAFRTGHAVAMTLDDGTELLVHIGIDTVRMKGEGFRLHVAKGDHVEAGQALVTFDRDAIAAAGHPDITPVVVLGDKEAVVCFE